jgi:hypothetical protein
MEPHHSPYTWRPASRSGSRNRRSYRQSRGGPCLSLHKLLKNFWQEEEAVELEEPLMQRKWINIMRQPSRNGTQRLSYLVLTVSALFFQIAWQFTSAPVGLESLSKWGVSPSRHRPMDPEGMKNQRMPPHVKGISQFGIREIQAVWWLLIADQVQMLYCSKKLELEGK